MQVRTLADLHRRLRRGWPDVALPWLPSRDRKVHLLMTVLVNRPFRHLCPEADERDAMTDEEFWERVLEYLVPSDPLDDDIELDPQIYTEPCRVCGSVGACGYDFEGRALIHATDLDQEDD